MPRKVGDREYQTTKLGKCRVVSCVAYKGAKADPYGNTMHTIHVEQVANGGHVKGLINLKEALTNDICRAPAGALQISPQGWEG